MACCQDCRKKDEEILYLKALITLNSVEPVQFAANHKEQTEVIHLQQRGRLLQHQLLLIRADVQYLNRELQSVLSWTANVIGAFLSCCGRVSEPTAAVIVDGTNKIATNVSTVQTSPP